MFCYFLGHFFFVYSNFLEEKLGKTGPIKNHKIRHFFRALAIVLTVSATVWWFYITLL